MEGGGPGLGGCLPDIRFLSEAVLPDFYYHHDPLPNAVEPEHVDEPFVQRYGRLGYLGIELTQLLLRIGSFQLSDLFYNTLGGFLGGAIYWLCRKRKTARRAAAQKLLEGPKEEVKETE